MDTRKPGSLAVAQDVLASAIRQLTQLRLPPLGPDFSGLSGTDLADALVVHRATKKFAKPGRSDSERRTSSINSMLVYDSQGPSSVPALRDIPLPQRRHLLLAKNWLTEVLRDFRPSHKVRFPSGESHESMDGWVDVAAKLACDTGWEVSMSCVPHASRIAYNNLQLKRAVKARFRSEFPDDPRPLRWYGEALSSGAHVGYYVFTRMFLACCRIVGTSRVTTVAKDNLVDRVITCEPFWNMVVQLSLASDLRACLESIGINLESAQDLHRGLIAHDSLATIDFSNASNSNWLCWLRFLWPPKVLKHILAARTGLFEVVRDGEVEYHPVNMLAPMGCGFTFEVMTLTLFALTRVLDPGSRVFGDDVIMTASRAHEFIDTMTYIGWQVNRKKTFLSGNFRESCGGFYSLVDRHHIVCYDFLYPEDWPGVFVLVQKIERICRAGQISDTLRSILLVVYAKLVQLVPRDAVVESRPDMVEHCCPTPLWRYLRENKAPTIFEQILKCYQWENTSLYRSFTYRTATRAVKRHEEVFSTVASFYAMRAHTDMQSRKKEDKPVRQTMVMGADVPLNTVGWFSVII